MNGRLFAVAALAMVGLTVVVVADGGTPRITTNDRRPVAIATLPCGTSLQSRSSGFVFDDRIVVTVAHAIHDSREFAVRDVSGTWHRAVVWHLDLERDLAVLRVEALRASPLPLAAATAGSPVHLLGATGSGPGTGTVVRPVQIRTAQVGDVEQSSLRAGYELDLAIAAGDSGSGVVDDTGQLVAVAFARSTRRAGVSWATAAGEIERTVHDRGVTRWECGPDPGTELVLDGAN